MKDLIKNKALLPQYLYNNSIYYSFLKYYLPIDYTYISRYSNTNTIFDNILGIYYHETINNKQIPVMNTDTYYTINVTTENRLDIIANMFYNMPSFWWIIAIANNITDSFNVPIGTVLRIPEITSLYENNSLL